MADSRDASSPSTARPVPTSSSRGSQSRSSGADSTSRATSTARLASPVASYPTHGTPPPIPQVPAPSQLNTESQAPLEGTGSSQALPGPGPSALAAAFSGPLSATPPRFGTPPLRPLSPSAAGAALQGSGPQTTYGSFETGKSGNAGSRRMFGINEDARIVKRHLVQPPSNSDGTMDGTQGRQSPELQRPGLQSAKVKAGGGTGIGDDEFSSLQLQGGDMTREVYRWTDEAESPTHGMKGKRSKSWHIDRPEPESETENASVIKQPGGFRRDYLRRRAPSPSLGHDGLQSDSYGNNKRPAQQKQSFITRNFIEFLTTYGHFAGEGLEEDDEDDYFGSSPWITGDFPGREYGDGSDSEPMENSALLTPKTPGGRRRKLKEPGSVGTNTPMGAALLLLKSFVGTGVLFLPKAYLNGGMLFSNLVLLGVAALSYYCFILLVTTRLKVEASFGDMGGILYGKWLRTLILSSVALSQVGFVSAYIVFTSENLQAFILAVSNCRTFIDIKLMVLMQLVIFLPLSLVRDITKLGITALIADAFIVLGLVYLYYYDIRTVVVNQGISDVVNFNSNDWTLFLGTAIFTFEGVGLILPIQESMKEPLKFPSVLAGVMIIITVIFVSMGALSYAAFGSATRTVVLLNLPQDDKFVNAVQLLYSLAILLSTPLQLFPAIRIMETELFSRSGKFNPWIKWKKNIFRFFLVGCCALIAWGGAGDLDKFVALVGSFACVPLVYVYPAMLHYKGVAETRRQRIADIMLCLLGLVAMVYTTVQTILNWVAGPTSPKTPGYCDE